MNDHQCVLYAVDPAKNCSDLSVLFSETVGPGVQLGREGGRIGEAPKCGSDAEPVVCQMINRNAHTTHPQAAPMRTARIREMLTPNCGARAECGAVERRIARTLSASSLAFGFLSPRTPV